MNNGSAFAEIAHATLQELRKDLDGGIGKSVYYTYITCIEKYFLPYFEGKRIEELKYTDMKEFELWRNRQMDNSVAMIEKHYSKLTVTMAADKLA